MIGYHPAMDPAHAAFRVTRLLLLDPEGPWERDRLRIADFMLLFPAFIPSMQLPREHLKWRNLLKRHENRYWYSGDPLMLFRRIQPLHETGVHLLVGVGALDETLWTQDGRARLNSSAMPDSVMQDAYDRNTEEADITSFLQKVVLTLRLTGPEGLKARTKLLEHRYDAD